MIKKIEMNILTDFQTCKEFGLCSGTQSNFQQEDVSEYQFRTFEKSDAFNAKLYVKYRLSLVQTH